MNRLPDSRRRFFGVSFLALLTVALVLWLLRRVPPADHSKRVPEAPEAR